MTHPRTAGPRVRLFVYGTLMAGGENRALLRSAAAGRPARTRGRLYHLPAGYPALQVPDAAILARAAAPDADAAAQDAALPHPPRALDAPWVYGELVEVDAGPVLRRVDALEGVRPGGGGLYERVLVPVWPEDGGAPLAAWTYVQEEPRGTYVDDGRWKPG